MARISSKASIAIDREFNMAHRATLTNHIDALKTEVLTILRFQAAHKRIFEFEDIQKISRIEFADRIIALKAIENDLVVRICKFADDTRGVHSFLKAIREFPSSSLNGPETMRKINEFQSSIKYIKKRRHEKLAHLKIGELDDEYVPERDLLPVIKLIVEIIDLMCNEKVNYLWSDGRYEKYDLREIVGI